MNNNFYNKTAAMFGLDARIALAIFGALSVITGAALYSAISSAKSTAIITEMDEMGKAVSAFMLDTGQHLKSFSGDNTVDGKALLEKTGTNWQGPYLSYSLHADNATNHCLKSGKFNIIAIEAYKPGPFANFIPADTRCDKGQKNCSYWAYISPLNAEMAKAIEKKIDGTANPGDLNLDGRFVYNKDAEGGKGSGSLNLGIPYPSSLSENAAP